MEEIVVGYDGSASAASALEWAAREAYLHAARLAVWTVLHRTTGDHPVFLEQLRDTVKQVSGDVPTEHHIGRGEPAAELVAACRDADLLVVGARGRNPLSGLLLGSVSRACLHAAPCDVAVVRAGTMDRPTRLTVMVAVDGSEAGRRALRVAASEARLRGAELQAVHAVHWNHLGAEFVAPETSDLVEWGHHLVAAELAATGVTARRVVLPGHAGDVLVRRSAEADLLVLGSRGRNPLAALLLGSTSDHCARQAPAPVMVVRA